MRAADHEPAPPAESKESTSPLRPSQAPSPAPSPARMIGLEQRAGWIVVAAATTAVGFSWGADVFHGDSQALLQAAIGAGLTVVLAAAVWYGRRIIAAFSAMAAGIAPVKSGFAAISLVCLVYGGYLLFRNTLAQRKAAMARPRRPPKAARARSAKSAADAAVVAGGVRRPSANRRYTPPKAKTPHRGR